MFVCGYNNAFYAALIQCFVVLFTIGLAYGSGTSVSGAGLSSVTGGVIELLYVFFAILVWGGLVGVSLTVVSDQEWLQPVVLTGSLIGVGAVAIGVASWLGLSTLVRSLVFFGTIGVWTVATYTVLWFDTSWFESVLGVAMYTWLVSYPYLLVNSVVSVLQTFSVLSGLVVNAMSALLSAAAIVHIVTFFVARRSRCYRRPYRSHTRVLRAALPLCPGLTRTLKNNGLILLS